MVHKFFFIMILYGMFCIKAIEAKANLSWNNCTLLPVTSDQPGQLEGSIFNGLEKFIHRNGFCQYQSNSSLVSVFSQYRQNLHDFLDSDQLVTVVGDRLQAGSILRVKLNQQDKIIRLEFIVYDGQDGRRISYYKAAVQNNGNVQSQIMSQLQSWTREHFDSIPYIGLVSSIAGDTLTIELSKSRGHSKQWDEQFLSYLAVGSQVEIHDAKEHKRHPLLKYIIEYVTVPVGLAVVRSNQGTKVELEMIHHEGVRRVQPGDWLMHPMRNKKRVNRALISDQSLQGGQQSSDISEQKPPSIGWVNAAMDIRDQTLKTQSRLGDSRQSSGVVLGAALQAEAWITRNFFSELELGKATGNLKSQGSNVVMASSTLDLTTVRVGGGYRFLPLGYFFGPRLDFYGGYQSINYSINQSADDGYEDSHFKGLYLGGRFDTPLVDRFRLIVAAELMPFLSYTGGGGNGASDSSSIFHLQLTGTYQWSTNAVANFGLILQQAKTKFSGGDWESLEQRFTGVRAGLSYQF